MAIIVRSASAKPSFDPPIHIDICYLPPLMADNSPVTKGDLKQDLKQLKEEIFRYFELKQEETHRHFDLTVETIRHDLLGANHDEIEVLKDTRKNHEERIVVLEEHAGIRR